MGCCFFFWKQSSVCAGIVMQAPSSIVSTQQVQSPSSESDHLYSKLSHLGLRPSYALTPPCQGQTGWYFNRNKHFVSWRWIMIPCYLPKSISSSVWTWRHGATPSEIFFHGLLLFIKETTCLTNFTHQSILHELAVSRHFWENIYIYIYIIVDIVWLDFVYHSKLFCEPNCCPESAFVVRPLERYKHKLCSYYASLSLGHVFQVLNAPVKSLDAWARYKLFNYDFLTCVFE